MGEICDRAHCRDVVGSIESFHDQALGSWYASADARPVVGALGELLLAQHRCNYDLWGLEDDARRRDVADSVIAATKRAIDARNQDRNDLIERLDDAILRAYGNVDTATAELHSETAGQMIDRLSILALKIRNMRKLADDRSDPVLARECAAKVAVLEEQRCDLAVCLRHLLDDFARGARYFKSYRQFKAYNDPRLNPALSSGGS